MYGYIKGTIENINDWGMVIDNNGIGYNILMPMVKCFELGSVGENVKVYTYTNVREDAINLFGFTSNEELELFKLLITVSGVGPKSGQELVNAFSVNDLERAIASEDAKLISTAPGVGKKTAERIIIDLKDKIKKFNFASEEKVTIVSTTNNDITNEAVEALVALGYSKKESTMATAKAVDEGAKTSEEILKGALKNL